MITIRIAFFFRGCKSWRMAYSMHGMQIILGGFFVLRTQSSTTLHTSVDYTQSANLAIQILANRYQSARRNQNKKPAKRITCSMASVFKQ